MIERYEDKKIKKIWSQRNRLKQFIKIEAALLEYFESKNIIKKGSAERLKKVKISPKEVEEVEKITKHDIIAFLEVLEKKSGVSQGLHMGLTSSDILDTATGLQLKQTERYVKTLIKDFLNVLYDKGKKYLYTPILGRTHNIIAEPTTVGLKLFNWYIEVQRSAQNFLKALKDAECGMISGAVGMYTNVPVEGELFILKQLKLKKAIATNQVIQRDIYARIITEGSIFITAMERIATNIRLLSHIEINEINEPFSKGQKGSSAMPHKKNPIRSERISGLARLVRGFMVSSVENMVLWHERDISNSSLERIIFPDFFHVLSFILKELTDIIKNMVIREEDIEKNIKNSNEMFYSGILLVELMKKGLKRKEAYEIIQKLVFKSQNENILFSKIVKNDPNIKKVMSKKEIEKIFKINYFLKSVDDIFKYIKKEVHL